METNPLNFIGHIGMKINDCELKDKIDNVLLNGEYRSSFYNQHGHKKIVDCKVFMQGEPRTFFVLDDGELISTRMFK